MQVCNHQFDVLIDPAIFFLCNRLYFPFNAQQNIYECHHFGQKGQTRLTSSQMVQSCSLVESLNVP